jgi:hypothetical protein
MKQHPNILEEREEYRPTLTTCEECTDQLSFQKSVCKKKKNFSRQKDSFFDFTFSIVAPLLNKNCKKTEE